MSKDWDALAHVNFLRQQGGSNSGYTADLLEAIEKDRLQLLGALKAACDYLEFRSEPNCEPYPLERVRVAIMCSEGKI